MSAVYPAGTRVIHPGDMGRGHPTEFDCDDFYHHGTVTRTRQDATGNGMVTVEFDCGLQRNVPAVSLLAEDDD